MNAEVKKLAEGETVKCQKCGSSRTGAFMYRTERFGDYEFGVGCFDCGWREY